MAKFSLLYTDVSNLNADNVLNNLDDLLDDILELQTKMDELQDKYNDLLAACKKANEELETLFSKSFRLSMIRIFPYTAADMSSNLTNSQRDELQKISPTPFIK